MRPSTLVSIIATACLSIAGSLVAAALFLQPPPSVESSASASADTIAAFYEAANEAIASGNIHPLDAILSPGFVDREPALGVTPDRDGLRGYLLALHTANPALQLRAEPILGAGNQAMARVTLAEDGPSGSQGSSILGGGTPWPPVEFFRIENGQVSERWSSSDGLSLVHPLASNAIDFPAPTPRLLTVQRISLRPGATFDHQTDGPSFLLLEKGALQLTVSSPETSPANAPAPEVLHLNQGQSFPMPTLARIEALNIGGGDSQALLVHFKLPSFSPGNDSSATPVPNEATRETLADGLAVDVTSGPWRIEFARVTLGSQADIAISSAAGPVFISATSGTFDVSTWGNVWQRRHADGMNVQVDASLGELVAGDGLTLQAGSQATLVNAVPTPATALVLTLLPDQEPS